MIEKANRATTSTFQSARTPTQTKGKDSKGRVYTRQKSVIGLPRLQPKKIEELATKLQKEVDELSKFPRVSDDMVNALREKIESGKTSLSDLEQVDQEIQKFVEEYKSEEAEIRHCKVEIKNMIGDVKELPLSDSEKSRVDSIAQNLENDENDIDTLKNFRLELKELSSKTQLRTDKQSLEQQIEASIEDLKNDPNMTQEDKDKLADFSEQLIKARSQHKPDDLQQLKQSLLEFSAELEVREIINEESVQEYLHDFDNDPSLTDKEKQQVDLFKKRYNLHRGDPQKVKFILNELSTFNDQINERKAKENQKIQEYRLSRVQSRVNMSSASPPKFKGARPTQRWKSVTVARPIQRQPSADLNQGADSTSTDLFASTVMGVSQHEPVSTKEVGSSSDASSTSKDVVEQLMDLFHFSDSFKREDFIENFESIIIGASLLGEAHVIFEKIDDIYTDASKESSSDRSTIRKIDNLITKLIVKNPGVAKNIMGKLMNQARADGKSPSPLAKKMYDIYGHLPPDRVILEPKKRASRNTDATRCASDLSKIAIKELSKFATSKELGKALSSLGNAHDNMSKAVIAEIMNYPRLEKANEKSILKKMKFYLKVADQSLKNGDMYSFTAITGALNSNALQRAKNKLSKADQEKLAEFSEISSSDASYKNLRENSQITVYPGVFSTDITFITDGNPSKIDEKINPKKLKFLGDAVIDISTNIDLGRKHLESRAFNYPK